MDQRFKKLIKSLAKEVEALKIIKDMIDLKKQKMLPILGVVIILLIAGIYMSQKGGVSMGKNISPMEAKNKAEAFVRDTLLGGKTQFTISDATEYAGLYKMSITLEGGGDPIDSYMTKDGKIFLPQGMDIAKMTAEAGGATADAGGQAAEPVAQVATKSDKPKVELFVMSHCPYGTQAEKGIIPVVKALGSKIDFQIKFVDYAMHEKKEIDEQTRQYCINKEQAPKFIPYLECFLKAGDSASCLKEQKVDEKKLASCITATDKQFKITESYNNKDSWGSQFPPFAIHKAENTKYGVQGSPTLVINGEQINSGRDAASFAKAICGAFTDGKAPKECSNTFASASPAPGFGTGTQAAGSGSDAAQCN